MERYVKVLANNALDRCADPDYLLSVYPSNFRCRFCLEEKALIGSGHLAGNRYCAKCLHFFALSTDPNAKPPLARDQNPPQRKARGDIRRWFADQQEWRWVSRKGKPGLSQYKY